MNRIILIGNGFDLAHDLKTSYRNFIDDYWVNKANTMRVNTQLYDEARHIELEKNKNFKNINFNFHELANCNNFKDFENVLHSYYIKYKFNNEFLEAITSDNIENWVDIEKEYYISLKKRLKDCIDEHGNVADISKVKQLNNELKEIKNLLIKYLKNHIVTSRSDGLDGLEEKVTESFRFIDFTQKYKTEFLKEKSSQIEALLNDTLEYDNLNAQALRDKYSTGVYSSPSLLVKDIIESYDASYYFNDLRVDNILLLNFNYTGTHYIYHNNIKKILSDKNKTGSDKLDYINIHGDLIDNENPVIFGFGDEYDESFSKIENLDDNEFLENIKSTKYHDTSNYKELLEYIDSDQYQIFIFGHSCGLSDRTLLSTLFNHENCVSIKPYYYKERNTGKDHYSDLVRNISRHFTDKASLRDKVVNKEYCVPLVGSK